MTLKDELKRLFEVHASDYGSLGEVYKAIYNGEFTGDNLIPYYAQTRELFLAHLDEILTPNDISVIIYDLLDEVVIEQAGIIQELLD